MHGDFNEFRVLEVLVESGTSTVAALRVEVTWGTQTEGGEPAIWDRGVFVIGAVGDLASVDVGDRLELRPASRQS
jgi:hypothetical protein